MSGAAGEDPDIVAAEYVLGLLDAAEAADVARRAGEDAALAAAIAHWESTLEPLAAALRPVAPSDVLWRRIERDLAPAGRVAAPEAPEAPDAPGRLGRWRLLALASMAVAAGLALLLVLRQPAAPPGAWAKGVALLAAPGSPVAALRATVIAGQRITVVPLRALDVPAGHVLGFWAWPKGQPAPVLLGMLKPQGGTLPYPFGLADGTPVMVTSEQAGGAGAAPGPTLFLGLLVVPG
jgi:anti-sigma-K factor RskA